MFNLVDKITAIIQNFGSGGVFVAGIIEQIVVPVPSPIVPMAGGFGLISRNASLTEAIKQGFFKVAVPFSLGSTLGSSIVFLTAYFGGEFLVNKFSKFLDLSWKDIERFKNKYFKAKATDELLIYLFMAIPVIPSSLVSGVAGAIQIRKLDFYLFTFLGLLTRGVILGTLGWWAGEAYQDLAGGVDRIESKVMIIGGLLTVLLLGWGYLKRDKILGRE